MRLDASSAALAASTPARLDVVVDADEGSAFRMPPGWQALIEAMQGAVWLADAVDLRIVAANAATVAITGLPRRRWLGRPVDALCASAEDRCFWDEVRAGLESEVDSESFVLRGERAVPVHRRISLVTAQTADGSHGVWLVSMQDRSEAVAAQRELALAVADLSATLESTHDGVLVTDLSGRIRKFNRRFATLWGLRHELLVRGDDDAVFESMRRAVIDPPGYMRRLAQLDDAVRAEATDVVELQSGQLLERIVRPQLAAGRPIGRVTSFRDVTDVVGAQRQLQALAFTDALTGLPNRRLLGDRVAQALALARRDGSRFSLLSIDLDHFADVNLQFGRRLADDVLRDAARRIAASLRQVDTVARLADDAFVIVAQQTDAAGATLAAARIAAALERPFEFGDGRSVVVGASIGIVLCPDDGSDIDTLLERADAAMREVKDAGRAGVRFWRPPADAARD